MVKSVIESSCVYLAHANFINCRWPLPVISQDRARQLIIWIRILQENKINTTVRCVVCSLHRVRPLHANLIRSTRPSQLQNEKTQIPRWLTSRTLSYAFLISLWNVRGVPIRWTVRLKWLPGYPPESGFRLLNLSGLVLLFACGASSEPFHGCVEVLIDWRFCHIEIISSWGVLPLALVHVEKKELAWVSDVKVTLGGISLWVAWQRTSH